MIQGVEKKVHFPLSPQTRVQINELRDLHPLLHPIFIILENLSHFFYCNIRFHS